MYRKRQRILIIAALLIPTFYFLGHSIIGERGLLNMFRLNQQLTESRQKLSELTVKQNIIEKRINGLNIESALDLDLLDEQARVVLGYADQNEKVIYNEISD